MLRLVVVLAALGAATTAVHAIGASQTAIFECDRVAADPEDTDRPADIPGASDLGDGNAAILVCQAALKEAMTAVGPQALVNLRRVRFELGRALEAAGASGEAKPLYEQAAEAGSAAAMTRLAGLYEGGYGVAQDYAVAIGWYEKAAAAGNAEAMIGLATLYAFGSGVPQNVSAAIGWYEKAAATGNVTAMLDLASLYDIGRDVPQNYAAAISWYEKAAAAGDTSAMLVLGAMYAQGRGVPHDRDAAIRWYMEALAAGSEFARDELAKLGATAR